MYPHTQPAALGGTDGTHPWADFRVQLESERLGLLKQLLDGGVAVHLSAAQGSAVTSLLWSVDAQRSQLSFGADAHSVHLQRLAQHDEAVAVAYLDSVKLQFDLVHLVLVHGSHGCTLRARLPSVIYRFQRRGSFRVRSADRQTLQARLRHPSMPDMPLALRILDISASGCALALPDDVPALQPGSRLHGVRIELDSDSHFSATLQLQHASTMHGGGTGLRLGCEFVQLDGAAQRALQRYIDHTQQCRRRLLPR